jgi:hypothetical protein
MLGNRRRLFFLFAKIPMRGSPLMKSLRCNPGYSALTLATIASVVLKVRPAINAARTVVSQYMGSFSLQFFVLIFAGLAFYTTSWCAEAVEDGVTEKVFLSDTNQSNQLQLDNADTLGPDRVFVRQGLTESTRPSLWKPFKRTEYSGRIVHIDHREVVLDLGPDGAVAVDDNSLSKRLRFPSDQVESVEPFWSGELTPKLVQLFDQGMYREFIRLLQDADLTPIPQWQQLLLLEMVVRAVGALQGPTAAAGPFLRLADSAPDFLHASMPLCWTFAELDRDFEAKCRGWLDSSSESAQLLGASWLIHGPESSRAVEVIKRLQSSSRTAISQLSVAQAWRIVTPPETMSHLNKWVATRDKMLAPLALGPTEFLVERLVRIGQPDLALGQALWIITIRPADKARASRLLDQSAQLLLAGGYQSEAERVMDWRKDLLGVKK